MTIIWVCLTKEVQELLLRYQWRNHRKKLAIPRDGFQPVILKSIVEPPEEIAQIMRQAKGRE